MYTYDFGDDWEHDILLEKIMEPEAGVSYPRCIKARRDTPMEDSRGEVIEEMDEQGRWMPEPDPDPKLIQEDINEMLEANLTLWTAPE